MSTSKAIEIIRKYGGIVRMSDAMNMGISRYTLYSMLEQGDIDRLSNMPLSNNLDLP